MAVPDGRGIYHYVAGVINALITVRVNFLLRHMFGAPDIPTAPKKEFSEEKYKEEKLWLERKEQGKIIGTNTDGTWFLTIGTASLIAFVIGGVVGTIIAYFVRSLLPVWLSMGVVFGISIYMLRSDFARMEIDAERGQILYEGNVSLGGELRSTRYRGPFEIIERTLLVRFRKFVFLKSKPYIRFMTNSGYMRINFKPEEEEEFLRELEKVGLVNVDMMKQALEKQPVRTEDTYIVYFEKKFDREEFFAKRRQKKQLEEHQKRIDKRIQRKKLVEKSKKFKEDTGEDSES